MICQETSGMAVSMVPLPSTSTPTPPTREVPEGGSKDTKSQRNSVKLMEKAESTTQNFKRPRPGGVEAENAIVQNVVPASVSSYSSMHSISHGPAPGASPYVSDGCMSLCRALWDACPLGAPYFLIIILRLARVHFKRASSVVVQDVAVSL
jgi:hypothetical protein